MTRWLSVVCFFCNSQMAYAEEKALVEKEQRLNKYEEVLTQNSSVHSTIGGGLGYMQLLHVDYSRMLDPDRSFDVSVTPLLMLNIGSFGMTKYYLSNNQIFVTPNLMLFIGIMDGSPAFGPGVRIGYQFIGERVAVKTYVGGNVLYTSLNNIQPVPDVGLTVLKVRREETSQ